MQECAGRPPVTRTLFRPHRQRSQVIKARSRQVGQPCRGGCRHAQGYCAYIQGGVGAHGAEDELRAKCRHPTHLFLEPASESARGRAGCRAEGGGGSSSAQACSRACARAGGTEDRKPMARPRRAVGKSSTDSTSSTFQLMTLTCAPARPRSVSTPAPADSLSLALLLLLLILLSYLALVLARARHMRARSESGVGASGCRQHCASSQAGSPHAAACGLPVGAAQPQVRLEL